MNGRLPESSPTPLYKYGLTPLVQNQFRAFSALKCHHTCKLWPRARLAMRWGAVAFVVVCAAVVRIRGAGEATDRVQ